MENNITNTAAAAFTDLADLDTRNAADAGFPLALLHPITYVPINATIHLVGADSTAYQSKQREQQRKFLQNMKTSRKQIKTPEEIEEDANDLLAACVTGWDNIFINKAPVEFSRANVKKVFVAYPWIREQADQAINDRANFTKKSATN